MTCEHPDFVFIDYHGDVTTRAVPDVPELVRYEYNILESAMEPYPSGEYVLYSQAAAIIAAKDASIELLESDHADVNQERARWKKRAEAAEAKLSSHKAARQSYADLFDGDVGSIHENIRNLKAELDQIKAQEPVATVEWKAINGRRVKQIYPITLDNVEAGTPLYASPATAPDADMQAENERLREALKKIHAKLEVDRTGMIEGLKNIINVSLGDTNA